MTALYSPPPPFSAPQSNSKSPTAVDPSSKNVYIADNGNYVLRLVSGGVVSTIAGGGAAASVDGPANFATFSSPGRLVVHRNGTIYMVDGNRIRTATCGLCPGRFSCNNGRVTKCPEGFFCPSNSSIPMPCGVGLSSPAASLSFADCFSCPAGHWCPGRTSPLPCRAGTYGNIVGNSNSACTGYCTAAPGFACGLASTVPAGSLCPAGSSCAGGAAPPQLCSCPGLCPAGTVTESGAGVPVWAVSLYSSAGTSAIEALAVNASNGLQVYASFSGGHRVVAVSAAGAFSAVAGTGGNGRADGPGTSAIMNYPRGIAFDPSSDNLFIADWTNHLIRVLDPSGYLSTFAGSGQTILDDGVGVDASFRNPSGVAVNLLQQVLVADYGNNAIRVIAPDGTTTTLAGQTGAGAVDGTGTSTKFNGPLAISVDASGNAFVSDMNNGCIRKVTPSGLVSTLAGSGSSLAVDGTGTAVRFYGLWGHAIDTAGRVYVADRYSSSIRMMSQAGLTSTLIRGVTGTSNTVLGYAAYAAIQDPLGLTMMSNGVLLISTNGGSIYAATCAACPAGLACDKSGDVTPCAPGTTCPSASSTMTGCPAGTNISTLASSPATACTACAAGAANVGGPLSLLNDTATIWDTGTILSNGTYWPPSGVSATVSLLIVGGGGGGGFRSNGGAGARFAISFETDGSLPINITLGRGGVGAPTSSGAGSGGGGTTIMLGDAIVAIAGGGGGAGQMSSNPYGTAYSPGGRGGFPNGVAGTGSPINNPGATQPLRGGIGGSQIGPGNAGNLSGGWQGQAFCGIYEPSCYLQPLSKTGATAGSGGTGGSGAFPALFPAGIRLGGDGGHASGGWVATNGNSGGGGGGGYMGGGGGAYGFNWPNGNFNYSLNGTGPFLGTSGLSGGSVSGSGGGGGSSFVNTSLASTHAGTFFFNGAGVPGPAGGGNGNDGYVVFLYAARSCTTCPNGTFSNAGASVCLGCPPGFFCPFEGTVVPTQCPVGFYCPANSTAPISCPCCSAVRLSAPTTCTATVSMTGSTSASARASPSPLSSSSPRQSNSQSSFASATRSALRSGSTTQRGSIPSFSTPATMSQSLTALATDPATTSPSLPPTTSLYPSSSATALITNSPPLSSTPIATAPQTSTQTLSSTAAASGVSTLSASPVPVRRQRPGNHSTHTSF